MGAGLASGREQSYAWLAKVRRRRRSSPTGIILLTRARKVWPYARIAKSRVPKAFHDV